MLDLNMPFVLASGSPRRKEILDTMGISYTIDVSDADENYKAQPRDMVMELSKRKAFAVAQRHPNSIILAADTLVFTEQVMGKPCDEEDAARMLRKLSGGWHSVFTGLTLINTQNGKILQNADETRVHFSELTEDEIADYIATNEPSDKAGAYAIQGLGGMFIDRIEGSYSNVVGLPMAMLYSMLKQIK